MVFAARHKKRKKDVSTDARLNKVIIKGARGQRCMQTQSRMREKKPEQGKKPEPALISFVLPAFVQQTHAGSSYLPMCSYMELKTISA